MRRGARRGPAAYDSQAIALNQIVKRDGVYYAFYHANCASPLEGLDEQHCAFSRSHPLGKVSRQSDRPAQLLKPDPRRYS